MDDLLAYLKSSITDEIFSKDEKSRLKSLIHEKCLDQTQLNFLRSSIYELAKEKINPTNYQFILEWIKTANSALITPHTETTEVFFSPGDACRNVIIRQN